MREKVIGKVTLGHQGRPLREVTQAKSSRSGGTAFQAGGITSTKALRQVYAWDILGRKGRQCG